MSEQRPRRGEVWLIDLGAPAGLRPALVFSDDWLNFGRTESVVVIPITSVATGNPLNVAVDGLTKPAFAMCDSIRSVALERVKSRLGRVSSTAMLQVAETLRMALAL
jgi:mRNA interferase MazF